MFGLFDKLFTKPLAQEDFETRYVREQLEEFNSSHPFSVTLEVQVPTDINSIVENYISLKIPELPLAQRECRTNRFYLEDHIEIGGVLSYDGVLKELLYLSKDKTIFSVYKKTLNGRQSISINEYYTLLQSPNGIFKVESAAGLCYNEPDLSTHNGPIIHWHTHPTGLGEPSLADVESWSLSQKARPEKTNYFVIRSAAQESSKWYTLENPK